MKLKIYSPIKDKTLPIILNQKKYKRTCGPYRSTNSPICKVSIKVTKRLNRIKNQKNDKDNFSLLECMFINGLLEIYTLKIQIYNYSMMIKKVKILTFNLQLDSSKKYLIL